MPSEQHNLVLYLFTHAFPYGTGEPFIAGELPYLAATFSRVILLPHHSEGACRPIPANVEVDRSLDYAALPPGLRLSAAACATFSPDWRREVGGHANFLVRGAARAASHLEKAMRVRQWVHRQIQRGQLDPEHALFYTYWLAFQTLGLCMAKEWYPDMRVVSRAHGWDIYTERHTPPYLPFRTRTMIEVDHVYPISDHGQRYLFSRYPEVGMRIHTAPLGVEDSGFLSMPSRDGMLRVLSCSAMISVKRLDLLIEGLAAFAARYPEQPVIWEHLGEGAQRRVLERLAAQILPPSITRTWPGQQTPTDIITRYREAPVDVFINTSESEGIPVSIMEAMSCGIPVIAPNVGGIPEIVRPDNGVLLPAPPTPDDIATALATFRSPTPLQRAAARATWQTSFDATVNYPAFAARLLAARNGE